jgi:cobalamin synthase
MLLALSALVVASRVLPMSAAAAGDAPVAVPRSELGWRIAVALPNAASVMWGADHLPAAIAGALLAVPITGSVLPCFTLPRHGSQATARLLAGFVRGQSGFVAFFVVLIALLPQLPKAAAFVAAVAAAVAAPLLLRQWTTATPARSAAE